MTDVPESAWSKSKFQCFFSFPIEIVTEDQTFSIGIFWLYYTDLPSNHALAVSTSLGQGIPYRVIMGFDEKVGKFVRVQLFPLIMKQHTSALQ